MKTKEELKLYFENGDIPKQEDFWEWQDAYWHKDEKIDMRKIAGLENGTFNILYAEMDADKMLHWLSFSKKKNCDKRRNSHYSQKFYRRSAGN